MLVVVFFLLNDLLKFILNSFRFLTAGYINPNTNGVFVEKGGDACVPGLQYNTNNIGHDTFTSQIIIPSKTGNVPFTLYSLAYNAGDLQVEDIRYRRAIEYNNGIMIKPLNSMTFDSLQPGTQYKMKLQVSANEEFYSPIITTKCYCEKVGNDDTGKPKHASVQQINGYITFQFNDNSRYV
jgi:hypothetical protein